MLKLETATAALADSPQHEQPLGAFQIDSDGTIRGWRPLGDRGGSLERYRGRNLFRDVLGCGRELASLFAYVRGIGANYLERRRTVGDRDLRVTLFHHEESGGTWAFLLPA
jgi:hypothetical protein